MPLLLAVPLAIVIALAVTALLLPLSLLQRFRLGRARRQVRGWLVAVNLWSTLLSAVIFAVFATVAGIWWPGVWLHAPLGFAGGLLLGVLGARLSRFESTPAGLFYQPNAWLVWALALLVVARVSAAVIQTWRGVSSGAPWPAHGWMSHASLLAVAGVLLGYALAYAWLLRRRWRHYQRYHGYDRSPQH